MTRVHPTSQTRFLRDVRDRSSDTHLSSQTLGRLRNGRGVEGEEGEERGVLRGSRKRGGSFKNVLSWSPSSDGLPSFPANPVVYRHMEGRDSRTKMFSVSIPHRVEEGSLGGVTIWLEYPSGFFIFNTPTVTYTIELHRWLLTTGADKNKRVKNGAKLATGGGATAVRL